MKVLIITYYWPPAGGSGVQRWLKFAKYLSNFGITPVIYTVDDASYPKEDLSLIQEIPKGIEVLKEPIWEPTDVLFWKNKNSKKADVSNAVNNGLLSFVRGNFFIPDPKIFWVKRSVKYLNHYLKNNKIDVIISTGPPHSMHLIAEKVSKKNKLKWIADFRDPWTDLYYNKNFNQLSFAVNKNKKLETSVLKNADCVLTVSNFLKNEFSKKSKRVEVITNGFDSEVINESEINLDKKFSISYIGLLPKQSNPSKFFNVLNEICKEDLVFKNDLKLNFVGDISNDVKADLVNFDLENNSEFFGYVAHQKAIEFQQKSQVLLLLIPNVEKSEGILTGKLFEYLTSKRPILAIGPEKGDLAEILKATNSGKVFNFENEKDLKIEIKRLYKEYKLGSLHVNSNNIEKYHRKNLTMELAGIVKSLLS